MEQYIPKSALVAEIEGRISQLESKYEELSDLEIWITAKEIEYKVNGLKEALSIVNTLEMKEADLNKELESWRHNHFHGRRDKEASGEYLERVSQLDLAKHFFELGLKSQKGEEV